MRIWLSILALLSTATCAFADFPPPQIQEADGSPSFVYRKLIVSNNTLTKNGTVATLVNDGTNSGWTDDGTTVRLTTSTDNVGIGTTAPSQRLSVAGGASFAGSGPAYFTDNVGIGISTPSAKLEITDATNTQLMITDPNFNSGLSGTIGFPNTMLGLIAGDSANNGTGSLQVVGIGNSTDAAALFEMGIQKNGSTSTPVIQLMTVTHDGAGAASKVGATEKALGLYTFDFAGAPDTLLEITGDGSTYLPKYVSCGSLTTNGSGLVGCGSASVGGWTDAGTNVYVTTSTDSVGIGNTAPISTLELTYDSSGTTDTPVIQTSTRTSSGTPGSGFGQEYMMRAENASNNIKNQSYFRSAWTSATNGAEYGQFAIATMRNGSIVEMLDIQGNSGITLNANGDAVNTVIKSDTNNAMIFVDGTNNKVGIGTTSVGSPFTVAYPSPQTIAAADVITADACGSIKQINAGGNVTTNTTNTFTNSTPGGCCMDVLNVDDTDTITLDHNSNFNSAGAADVVLGPGDTARVCSNGTLWFQVGATGNN